MDTNPIVYVVDDDPSVRNAVQMLLQASGFTVETCDSAQEFLKRDLARRFGLPGARCEDGRTLRAGPTTRIGSR